MQNGLRFEMGGIKFQSGACGCDDANEFYAWNLTTPDPENKMVKVVKEDFDKAVVTPFEKVAYIAKTVGFYGVWGKGKTVQDSIKQVRKAGAKLTDKVVVYEISHYADQEAPSVSDYGSIHYHGNLEKVVKDPLAIKKVISQYAV